MVRHLIVAFIIIIAIAIAIIIIMGTHCTQTGTPIAPFVTI